MFLLDTNIASHVIKGDLPRVRERLQQVDAAHIGISVITQAELLYGVAKRSSPEALVARVRGFLMRVTIFSWDEATARAYALLRVSCERAGTVLSPMDLMIAAQVLAFRDTHPNEHVTLVTRDQAFYRLPISLRCEDWSKPI